MLSEEQSVYVNHNRIDVDTKLLATGGSGKTHTIIARISHVAREGWVESDAIYMLTFSKNAKDDFRTRVRKANATDYIPLKNICTIDSFAYKLLGQTVAATIDVSLLSYAWMDELENKSKEYLLDKYPKLRNIKMIFVDEAQDLNEIQYRILVRMKDVCGTTIHMVGDPNQNIYQFRNASDKYLVNFPAKEFYLTRNFRSQAHIVDFCSNLRPYNNVQVVAENPKHEKLDVTFYAYDTTHTFEHLLISTLHLFQARKISLHKVAILAPTRGYIRSPMGACKYKGLCYIANLLYHHNIPFVQFYSDTNASDPDAFEAAKVKYKPVQGQLNLMTYTASKGLEWDYVILIDANAHLISRMNYDEAKFMAEKYLLYVACSRPRKNLLVFTKSKYANPWFKDVPEEAYKIAARCRAEFDFFDSSNLYDKPAENNGADLQDKKPMSPNAMIATLNINQLYAFDKRLRGKHMMVQLPPISQTPQVVNVPESRGPFMRFFMTHLYFTTAINGALPLNNPLIIDIHNVLTNVNILVCNSEKVMTWYFENRASMNWEMYDMIKDTLAPRITGFIDSRFDREQPFNSYTLVDKFYESYIHASLDTIKRLFEEYVDNEKRTEKTVMHLSRIAYAIKTTHYFYIKQDDLFEKEILSENKEAIKELVAIAKKHRETGFIQEIKHYVSSDEMFFYYDKTHDGRNLNIRTRNALNIKDILAGIMIQHIENRELPFTEFYTLQLSPPSLYKYTITITPDERSAIVDEIRALTAIK